MGSGICDSAAADSSVLWRGPCWRQRAPERRLWDAVTGRPFPGLGLGRSKGSFSAVQAKEAKLKRRVHRPCLLDHGPQSVPSHVHELRECPGSGTLESLLSTRSHAQPCLSFSSFVPYHAALFDREENEGAEKLNSLHKATQLAGDGMGT